jgi:uncharacterized protein (TIGR02452 family)
MWRYMIMGRDENVAVFKDTEELCRTNGKLAEALKKSVAGQKVILEDDELGVSDADRGRFGEASANVVVSAKRTFEAASAYRDTKVAVLNFASASNPGGGVVRGATAQEECLCRCSDLYFCLNRDENWNKFYSPHRNERNPLHNDDIIYTPNVTVFKSDTANPKLMPESEWYDVDVITCAAPNLREKPSNAYNTGDGAESVKITDKELQELHEKRLHRILDVAVANGVETIILGAFGCGAFSNDPNVVAKASQNVLKSYLHDFKNIEFAVYCSPRDDSNFKIFSRVIGGR